MIKRISSLLIITAILIIYSSMTYAGGGGGGGISGGGSGGSKSEPQYYSFEDLRSGIRDQSFHFENAKKPANAKVSLGYFLTYPSCASKNAKISSSITAEPAKYKIDGSRIYNNWNDYIEIPMDWNNIEQNTERGDLIFSRGNGKGPDFVKFFSNWTHVAILDDPHSKKVFESTPDTNVDINYAPKTWNNITYYTCKKLKTISSSFKTYLLYAAEGKYKGLPYFPKISKAIDLLTFVYRWSDRDDEDSMYCSKLVYKTYRPFFDMNTGRTSVSNPKLQKAVGEFLFSWIGVSPDNIYYSSSLGPDFCYSQNI